MVIINGNKSVYDKDALLALYFAIARGDYILVDTTKMLYANGQGFSTVDEGVSTILLDAKATARRVANIVEERAKDLIKEKD
jgi:hypothetical protein